MQYVSSFFGLMGPSASMPNVFMFDSKENPDFSTLTDLTKANTLARKARAVLAFNGFLNPVRGLKSGKYHFTLLKYSLLNSVALSDTTDIVTQTGDGVLSGNSSIAASQTYIAITSGRNNIYLTTGMIAGQPIQQPPVTVHDGNCPYGQYATAYYGNRYIDQSGNMSVSTSSIGASTGVCSFATVRAQEVPTVAAKMMQTPTSMSVSGANGTPGLGLSVAYDGTFCQTQTGTDESVVLDCCFFYNSQMKALIKLGSDDFTPIAAVPGTRPRWSVNKQQITL